MAIHAELSCCWLELEAWSTSCCGVTSSKRPESLKGRGCAAARFGPEMGDFTEHFAFWRDMGVGQNLLLSILMGWTSIYQLFWGSLGARVLTNSHIDECQRALETRRARWSPEPLGSYSQKCHLFAAWTWYVTLDQIPAVRSAQCAVVRFGARGGTDEGIGKGWFLYVFIPIPKCHSSQDTPSKQSSQQWTNRKMKNTSQDISRNTGLQNWWRVHSLTLQRLCCSILEISVFGSSFTILSKTGCSNELSVDTARQLWEISESTLDPVG